MSAKAVIPFSAKAPSSKRLSFRTSRLEHHHGTKGDGGESGSASVTRSESSSPRCGVLVVSSAGRGGGSSAGSLTGSGGSSRGGGRSGATSCGRVSASRRSCGRSGIVGDGERSATGLRGRVGDDGVVARGLDVRLGLVPSETLRERLQGVRARLVQGHGQDVTDGEVDGGLVQIVLQDDEPSVELFGRLQDGVEPGQRGLTVGTTSGNVPVVRIKDDAVTGGPDDRGQTHLCSDGSDTVVDVTVRRPEGSGSDTDRVLDDLHRPTELGDDLGVGEVGQVRVGPGVDRDLVTGHVFADDHLGSGQDSGTDDEEGGLQVIGVDCERHEARSSAPCVLRTISDSYSR